MIKLFKAVERRVLENQNKANANTNANAKEKKSVTIITANLENEQHPQPTDSTNSSIFHTKTLAHSSSLSIAIGKVKEKKRRRKTWYTACAQVGRIWLAWVRCSTSTRSSIKIVLAAYARTVTGTNQSALYQTHPSLFIRTNSSIPQHPSSISTTTISLSISPLNHYK